MEEYGVVSDCCGACVNNGDICEGCGEHCECIEEEADLGLHGYAQELRNRLRKIDQNLLK